MKMDTVVTKEAINQTIMDISSGSSPLFLPVHPIQVRDHIYKQVPGDTNYVCVHNYATPESLLADWTGSKRADTLCTCVTFVFPRAIMTEINTRCFICTIALVQWISRSLKKKASRCGAVLINHLTCAGLPRLLHKSVTVKVRLCSVLIAAVC